MAKWPYNTTTWKRIRRLKLSMTPMCEYCPPGRLTAANHVDHRQAISDGGEPYDMVNLVSCCQSCHNRKTAVMDGGYGNKRQARVPVKGCDADGRPLDPEHAWNKNDDISLKE